MAPKKGQKQKMSLGDFLGDEKFGSWADEMESLPTAPAARASDDAPPDRYARGDREFSSRPDRPPIAPREDLPLPTAPPYIAYVGNLSFDLIEDDLGSFFAPELLKSVKVIRDRDDKPKGFGYVEFETLDGLKNGLAKSGTQLNSRTVRVSVAEPPKERERGSGFTSFAGESGDWRRDGPPPTSESRGPRGSRFDDRPPREPVEAEVTSDWRSNQPSRSALPAEPPRRAGSGFRDAPPRSGGELNWERKAPAAAADTATNERPGNFRRGSGFSTPAGDKESAPPSAAETDDVWRRGPPRASIQTEEQPPRRGGFGGGRGGEGSASGGPPDTGDWRSLMRGPTARQASTDEKSPTSSQPQTPQGGRKQLNLLPRSATGSNVASPLSSPRMANSTAPKANPFGAARPVDVSTREREVSDKLEKERESRTKEKAPFGRPGTDSRRDSASGGPPTRTESAPRDRSPTEEEKKERPANKFDAKAAQVRAQTSFAAAAAAKKEAAMKEAADKLGEVTI